MKTKLTKLETRLENIKKVGYKLFLERGYENTSFKDIIKITGGSYSSIYDKYGSKENFFRIIFEEKMVSLFTAFDKKVSKKFHLELEDFLKVFACEFLTIVQNKQNIQAYRLIMSVSYQNPSMQKWLSGKLEFAMHRILSRYFEQSKEVDSWVRQNSVQTSKLFCAYLNGYILTEKMILGGDLDGKELCEYVEVVVKLSLYGIKVQK